MMMGIFMDKWQKMTASERISAEANYAETMAVPLWRVGWRSTQDKGGNIKMFLFVKRANRKIKYL